MEVQWSKTSPPEDVHCGRKDVFFILFWITFGWIFFALSWCFLFIYDDITTEQDECDLSAAASSSTTFQIDDSTSDTCDMIFKWMQLSSQTLVVFPLISVISLYMYTNLHKLKRRNRLIRCLIFYSTVCTVALPFGIYPSKRAD